MSRYATVRVEKLEDWSADLDVLASNLAGDDDSFTDARIAEILAEIAADMRLQILES